MDKLKTRDEIIQDLRSPFKSVLNRGGIDDEFLVKRIKQELNAKETRVVKAKGALTADSLPKTKKGNVKPGYKIIGTSGVIETLNTLLAVDFIDWGIRQKARMDVHKLRGDYPAEKHELMTDRPLQINVVKFSDMEDENG